MKKYQLLLIITVLGTLVSCKNYYYFPTSQNVMDFKQKKDINLEVGSNLSTLGNFHLGYAFTDNFGFITKYNTFDMTFGIEEYEEDKENAYIWDNELILYKNINNKIFPALNIGFSYGNLANNIKSFDLDMYRYYLQPSIGFLQDNFELALSSRFSKVDYNVINKGTFVSENGESLYEHYDLRDIGKEDFYFIEPAVTIGWVYENFQFRYQIINTLKINSGDIFYKKTAQVFTINITINVDELRQK